MSPKTAYPFVKWAGGKRALVPEIHKALPNQFNTYWEPFVGGGAVFFSLASRLQVARLSDINSDLMLTYSAIAAQTDRLVSLLQKHKAAHNPDYYYLIRVEGHDYEDPVERAARFIYLNKTCFNGLYRVNRKGHFNVPIGRYINPAICDLDNLRNVAKVLNKTTLACHSFEAITPQAGDLVYCDPPYDGTFTNYTNGGFTAEQQEQLRDYCRMWLEAGAFVIASNNATERVRSLYQDFRLIEVQAPRSINSNPHGRTRTSELLITGH